jgi:hypothetical protein
LPELAGACEFTDTIVALDEEMGDGFTAQDVVDITEGTYEETLSWDASGDTAGLTMTLTFTEDAAVWRTGIYYDADGVESLSVDCGDEMLLVGTLGFMTDDGLLEETLDVEVRSTFGTSGRIDAEYDSSVIEGVWGDELAADTIVQFAINLGMGSTAGEIAIDDGAQDGMTDTASWGF